MTEADEIAKLKVDLEFERALKESWRSCAKDWQFLVGQYKELLAEFRKPECKPDYHKLLYGVPPATCGGGNAVAGR